MRELWKWFESLTRVEKTAIAVILTLVVGHSVVEVGQFMSADKVSVHAPGKATATTTAPQKPSAGEVAGGQAEAVKQAQQWSNRSATLSGLVGPQFLRDPDKALQALASTAGSSSYQSAQRAMDMTMAGASPADTRQEAEQRYLFTMDLLKSLRLCVESREGEVRADDKLVSLKAIYNGREKLLEAKTIMEHWKDSNDPVITELDKNFVRGLDDCILAAELFGKVFDEMAEFPESDAALGAAKLTSGRQAIFKSAFSSIYVISSERPYEIGDKPGSFYLSAEQLASIVKFTEANFKEEISAWKAEELTRKVGKTGECAMPEEAWAALLLRQYILQRI